jgi:hypothetical protein
MGDAGSDDLAEPLGVGAFSDAEEISCIEEPVAKWLRDSGKLRFSRSLAVATASRQRSLPFSSGQRNVKSCHNDEADMGHAAMMRSGILTGLG